MSRITTNSFYLTFGRNYFGYGYFGMEKNYRFGK